MLRQLLYVSVETHPYTKEQLTDLLKKSRVKNAKLGITGILLFYKKHFFQVLEGEKEDIFKLFRTIRADERHTSVILVHDQPISQRSFGDWTMAFVDINKLDKSEIEGFSDFLEKGFTSAITPEHLTLAQKLLLKFKNSL